ncbi:hypothetical protein CEP53_002992 [Fusarium sp. AF-6]|nr:hypothetical protein CEP53_002992 [Fusarium sp. AF-6]
MFYSFFFAILAGVSAAVRGQDGSPRCRCVPGQSCWPSDVEWKSFNRLVGGSLIKTEPVAQSCYPGDTQDLEKCAYINKMWPDQDFQTSNPIGRPYPYNITCAPVDLAVGQEPTTCTLGSLLVYAVRATSRAQIRSTLLYARQRNIRLVISGTGHDLLGRSDGYGGLELWLHHFKNDQILEAEVMLADGRVITCNHCENTDLFRALRGGGPGYGITLSSTIKAHPNVDVVTAHHLQIAPLEKTEKNSDLLDAVSVLLQMLPDLNDAGFSGYGFWFRNFPTVFVGNATSGYSHGFWTIDIGKDEAEKAWAPVRKALSKFEGKLFINESWASYSDYWSFYDTESGLHDPVGDTAILTSRLINRESLNYYTGVRDAVEVISGKSDEFHSNVVLLVSGGQVFKDAKDKTSGLNPAWRKSHYALISGTGVSKTASLAERNRANYETTFVKGTALKKLAPDTGAYMNEGDRNDPDFKASFYGDFYDAHLKTKHKYDPSNVFYCPTCVGSDAFIERPDGPLCKAKGVKMSRDLR